METFGIISGQNEIAEITHSGYAVDFMRIFIGGMSCVIKFLMIPMPSTV
jgi:hypothetical protein